MKIYNYDRFDKFLTFEEEAQLDPVSKSPMLPAFATFHNPPINIPKGMIPVFDNENWVLVENTFWFPQIESISFYTGKDSNGIPKIPIPKAYQGIYPSIPRIMNGALFWLKFPNRIKIINQYIENIYHQFETIRSTNG